MTAPHSSVQRFFRGLWLRLPPKRTEWPAGLWSRAVSWFDNTTTIQRKFAAVIGSLLLHLGWFLLLLPSATGLSSIGTTGIGSIDGFGTGVTLVDASELPLPKASKAQSSAARDSAASESVTAEEASEPMDQTENVDEVKPKTKDHAQAKTETLQSDSQAPSDSGTEAAAGAHGQSGQANTDLWNAIAPCWNLIADRDTLSTTLTISFAADGGLSVPPVIERDPDAPITNQSLQSEAKALAALAECGAYPMVKGQHNVTVQFPTLVTRLSTK